jgi:tetratricopeptide (TPR) repeat protein
MSKKLRIGLLLSVAASAVAVYARTIAFKFVYDDLVQIVLNPRVQSWHYFPQYFTKNLWVQATTVDSYYRPVFLVWLLLNHTLFQLNEWGWHLSNVLLHASASVLVFMVARRVLKQEAAALAAAFLFALHPAHVESVAWVSGSTDPLLAIFFLGAYLAFAKSRETATPIRYRWLGLAGILFLLALLTKETAVVLLPLLAVEVWFFGSEGREPVRSRVAKVCWALLPFALVFAIYMALRIAALHSVAAVVRTPLPWSTVLMTWPWLLGFYLKKLFWAPPMSQFYDAPYFSSAASMDFWLPLMALLVFGAALWFWYRRSKDPAIPWAFSWMLLPLVPTLDVRIFTPHEYAHDRYLYLPALGFCVLVAKLLWELPWSRWVGAMKVNAYRWAGAAVVMLLFAAISWNQSIYWANELNLYERGAKISPKYGTTAMNNLVPHLMAAGRTEEAMQTVREVARRQPQDMMSQFNAGSILLRLGRYEEAEAYFEKASQLAAPNNALPLLHIGLTRMKMGKPAEAEPALREAAIKAPNNPEFRYALALDLKEQGRLGEASDILQQLVASAPNVSNYRQQLQQVQGQLAEKKPHGR